MLIRIVAVIASLVVMLVMSAWLGLRVNTTSFPLVAPNTVLHTIPLPPNLPPPVLRLAQAHPRMEPGGWTTGTSVIANTWEG